MLQRYWQYDLKGLCDLTASNDDGWLPESGDYTTDTIAFALSWAVPSLECEDHYNTSEVKPCVSIFVYYPIYLKYWDTFSVYHTCPKIWNSPFCYLLTCLKSCCMYGKLCRS